MRNRRKWFKISKVFMIYLASNLLMMMIPGISIVLYNREMRQSTSRTIDVTNAMTAQQFQLAMDSALGEIDELYKTLYSNPQIATYLYRTAPYADSDYYAGVELIQRLSAIRHTGSIVSDYYLYFPASDTVITPESRLKSRLYHDFVFQLSNLNYEDWIQKMRNGKNYFQMLGDGCFLPRAQNYEMIALYRPLYLTASNELNPVLVCIIRRSDLQKKF